MQRRKKHGFLALLAVILIFMMTVPGTVPGALAASVPEAGESSIEGVTMNPESASETEVYPLYTAQNPGSYGIIRICPEGILNT